MRLLLAGVSSAAVAALVIMPACAAAVPPVTYTVMPSTLAPIDGDHNKARDFGRAFCGALTHFKDPDGHSWGDCSKYIEIAEPPQAQPAFTTPYRFMLVGGFGGNCLKDVRAFGPSIAHLKDAHQIAVEPFAVAPYASSEENGKSIAKHIDEGWAADKAHRYVLIGYDKGAADLLEALRVLDAAPSKVAGIVTIAGIIGGVWLPDDVRALMQPAHAWIDPGCPANVQDGMGSLAREVRHSVLRSSPLQVPGYSLVGSSTLGETSTVLQPMWRRLSVYAREQDGELVAWEAVVPDGRYLGSMRADHWAIALPFDEASGEAKGAKAARLYKGIDKNRFPRDAMFEAVVRFVSGDLPTAEPAPRGQGVEGVTGRHGS
jgi:hypothetical protein